MVDVAKKGPRSSHFPRRRRGSALGLPGAWLHRAPVDKFAAVLFLQAGAMALSLRSSPHTCAQNTPRIKTFMALKLSWLSREARTEGPLADPVLSWWRDNRGGSLVRVGASSQR